MTTHRSARRRTAFAAFIAASGLLLSACGNDQATSAAPDPSAVDGTSSDGASCAALTGTEALEEWIGEVPEVKGWPWSTELASVEGYDPCLPLSWIRVTIENGSSSSPFQIMLFHEGEYVGTATEESYGFGPDVSRIDDSTIEVTWYWAEPGESNAGHTGESRSRFTWDSSTGEVTMTGDLPDVPGILPDGSAAGGNSSTSGSGAPGVGGGIPADATPVRTVKPYSGGVAVFQTPSKNISCGIYPEYLRCGISSYNQDEPYGSKRIGGAVDTVYVRGGTASMDASSDPGAWMPMAFGADDKTTPQIVDYGDTVYHGTFACLSEETGLTCWDSATGAGAFMSREKTELF